jgi:hypothetical protein
MLYWKTEYQRILLEQGILNKVANHTESEVK